MPTTIKILQAAALAAITLLPAAHAQSFDELEVRLAAHPTLSALKYDAEANRERGFRFGSIRDVGCHEAISKFAQEDDLEEAAGLRLRG